MDGIDPTIYALAAPTAFFVNAAVDVVKRVLRRSPRRDWLLPLWGTGFGIVFVGLMQVYRGAAWTLANGAGVVLAGFLAYLLAALLNDQSARAAGVRPPRQENGRG